MGYIIHKIILALLRVGCRLALRVKSLDMGSQMWLKS